MSENIRTALVTLTVLLLLCCGCAKASVSETASLPESSAAESEDVQSESEASTAEEPSEAAGSEAPAESSGSESTEQESSEASASAPVSSEPSSQSEPASVPSEPASTAEPVSETSSQEAQSAEASASESEAAAEEASAVPASEAEMTLTPLTGAAPVSSVLSPSASGTVTYGNQKADIDASNTDDGYVMIRYLGSNSKVKIQITGPSGVTYTYNVTTPGSYEVFPLSDGSGTYKIGIYENTSGKKYAVAYSLSSLSVSLRDSFAPFLRANQYVNYTKSSKCVSLAAQLCAGTTDTLEKISAVYTYVINNISYDYNLAANVKSGYLPDLDSVLRTGKGICFDYAALMTAMLRSQGIPTKLVVGYSGQTYHAWINTYSDEEGWMDAVIYFDGTRWKLMDPTYASTGKSDAAIMEYIGNGANYTAKYLY